MLARICCRCGSPITPGEVVFEERVFIVETTQNKNFELIQKEKGVDITATLEMCPKCYVEQRKQQKNFFGNKEVFPKQRRKRKSNKGKQTKIKDKKTKQEKPVVKVKEEVKKGGAKKSPPPRPKVPDTVFQERE